MEYNERTGDFERTAAERVGYVVGYSSLWMIIAVVMALTATAVYKMGTFIWNWIGL